jgi:DMSO/TMAO reductase YedYZ heme-binding membrane subunit
VVGVLVADHGDEVPLTVRKALAYALPLVPLAACLHLLAARPPGLQRQAGDVLGLGAALCLLGCLAVSPLAAVTGMRQAGRWRQWYGLCVFVLGAAGLVISASGGVQGCAGTVQQWTGTLIVVLLVPAAVTSNRLSQKLLGGYWKMWQRRVAYAAWLVLGVHLVLLGGVAWRAATGFAMMSVPLVAARLPGVRGQLTRFRRARMSAPRVLRVLVPAGLLLFTAGAGLLFWLEGTAVVHAA